MSRETLHSLVDIVDEKEIDTAYRILLKFVEEDVAAPDEVEAIRESKQDIASGDLYTHEEVWS